MSTTSSRRAILAGAATALAGGSAVNLTAIAIAAPAEIDPIFAVIDHSRQPSSHYPIL